MYGRSIDRDIARLPGNENQKSWVKIMVRVKLLPTYVRPFSCAALSVANTVGLTLILEACFLVLTVFQLELNGIFEIWKLLRFSNTLLKHDISEATDPLNEVGFRSHRNCPLDVDGKRRWS